MCGIAGAIGFDQWNAAGVLRSIAHRGPDSHGHFIEDKLFLGHTRLAIQDLSENGNQPMFSTDGRFVMIFNGEIYNHLEIRETLGNQFSFRSSGDSETILNAYIKHGPSFLNQLNGIFALAIYDRHTRELLIARDQMGVKPLYIYQDDRSFLFASEIKAFLSFPINKELKPEAFANYLSFLWSPGTLTPFSRVTKLLPGHYLKFSIDDLHQPQAHRYYQIPFRGEYLSMSEKELTDLLEEKLIKAVKRQMLSDVPVGFFLSGGLDSSLLVAIAKRIYPGMELPCFTIEVNQDDTGSEDFNTDIYYAKKVAEYLDVPLHYVKAEIDIVRDFDKMIWHLDEPQADAAPLNVYNIAILARSKGIKVLLGGAGGDDLFSGYRRHQALRYERLFSSIPSLAGKALGGMAQWLPSGKAGFRKLKKVLKEIGKPSDKRMAGYFQWLPWSVVSSLFSEEWKKRMKDFSPDTQLLCLNNEIPEERNILNRMLYWEMKTFLVDHNLNYTDKMGMAVGVEARVPYLDMELVEFSTRIPPEMKMKGSETKYLLRKVAERYLPHDVIYRPKVGFGAPVRKWITKDMNAMIAERLSPEKIRQRGIFDPEKISKLIEDNRVGRIDASYSIWALLAIESWLQQFHDGKG